MIRKLPSGQYRLYSRKISPKIGKRRNLGTFKTLVEAQRHERAVQYFKRLGKAAMTPHLSTSSNGRGPALTAGPL